MADDPLVSYLKPMTDTAPVGGSQNAPADTGDPLVTYLKPPKEEVPQVPGYDPETGKLNGSITSLATKNRLDFAAGMTHGVKTILNTVANGMDAAYNSSADLLASKGIISQKTADDIHKDTGHTLAARSSPSKYLTAASNTFCLLFMFFVCLFTYLTIYFTTKLITHNTVFHVMCGFAVITEKNLSIDIFICIKIRYGYMRIRCKTIATTYMTLLYIF